MAARTDATQQFARERFGKGIAVYADYTDLLSDETVEAVMVALPDGLHSPGTEAPGESGKHVFFDPPIGHTEEQIRRVLGARCASDRVIQCDLALR